MKSAKEAKNILSVLSNHDAPYKVQFAKGYLAALRGAEVKALLEIFQTLLNWADKQDNPDRWLIREADKVIAQYREAVKP